MFSSGDASESIPSEFVCEPLRRESLVGERKHGGGREGVKVGTCVLSGLSEVDGGVLA